MTGMSPIGVVTVEVVLVGSTGMRTVKSPPSGETVTQPETSAGLAVGTTFGGAICAIGPVGAGNEPPISVAGAPLAGGAGAVLVEQAAARAARTTSTEPRIRNLRSCLAVTFDDIERLDVGWEGPIGLPVRNRSEDAWLE